VIQKDRAFSTKYHLKSVSTFILYCKPPITGTVTTPYGTFGIFLLGLFEHSPFTVPTITIWLYKPQGEDIQDEQELRNTWEHEYLHYIDFCLGCDPPVGAHNDLFNKRITDMGWRDKDGKIP